MTLGKNSKGSGRGGAMYADIAAHRAVRSWFLRLIVNVVICALLLCIANKEYVLIYSCVVITKYDNITSGDEIK